MRILSVFGTRPEAIKMAPLVLALGKRQGFDSRVCVTGQHRDMLDRALADFAITPDYDLNLMRAGQTPLSVATGVMQGLQGVFDDAQPELVLVHGDTTTAMAAALAAAYRPIPVGHVEAGLRSFDKSSPFPEEINRLLCARLATLHFAPTETNRQNLLREGIEQNVFVTGNTVIDALHMLVRDDYRFRSPQLADILLDREKILLVTAHRRENLGEPLRAICRALARLVEAHPDLRMIFPMHPNPRVRETVQTILGERKRIHLIKPLDTPDMHNLMAHSTLIATDSGGLQEEAPALGKPVLVLRTETERAEAVKAGTVLMAGVNENDIFAMADRLLRDPAQYARMAKAANPYGDGHASQRIIEAIEQWERER